MFYEQCQSCENTDWQKNCMNCSVYLENRITELRSQLESSDNKFLEKKQKDSDVLFV